MFVLNKLYVICTYKKYINILYVLYKIVFPLNVSWYINKNKKIIFIETDE